MEKAVKESDENSDLEVDGINRSVRFVPIEALPIEALPIEALPIEALPIEALPVRRSPGRTTGGGTNGRFREDAPHSPPPRRSKNPICKGECSDPTRTTPITSFRS